MVVKLRGKRASRQVCFKAAEIPRPGGIEIPPFIPWTASERTVIARVPRQTATLRDRSGTRTSPYSPPNPRVGRSERTKPNKPHEYLSRGTQRRDPAIPHPAAKDGVRMEVVCMRTVRCASTEPASKSIPITTHTPSRERRLQHCQADHPPMQCHKASFG